jgi:hypothetical protein
MSDYSLTFFCFRILTITLAVIAAFYITSNFIKPKVLDNMCLTDTFNCASIKYLMNKEGSVLVHMVPTGYWWFYSKGTGRVYIYGEPVGATCPGQNVETSYVLNISENIVTGYECVKTLDEIKKDFEGVKEGYIYHKVGEKERFNVVDCVNLFIKNGIIN